MNKWKGNYNEKAIIMKRQRITITNHSYKACYNVQTCKTNKYENMLKTI